MALLIKNGTVVNDDQIFRADVVVTDGVVSAVGLDLQVPENCRVIDATDRLVIPGGIDPHTHIEFTFMGAQPADTFYTATAGALAGGTTMVIDFVIPEKSEMPLDAYKKWRARADPKVCCDYGLSVAITSWNDEVTHQMEVLTSSQYGINSFKFYLAYSGLYMVSDVEMYCGMKQCSKLGAMARVHAEHGTVIVEKEKELLDNGITGPEGHTLSRPEELEAEATNMACTLAAQANCPLYVVHVMSKGAAKAIASHRQKGAVIFGEAIAAALALDGSHYYHPDWLHAARHVMSPPLSRDPTTPEFLMDLLAASDLHLTGTDNCTFNCEAKSLGRTDFTKIPNGLNGIEDRMSVIWDRGVECGKIDPMRFVEITSTMAAKLFNIYPKKGRIAVGSDADIVIWNPRAERVISRETHHQAVDYNIFEGMRVRGVAETTICKGKVVWHEGKLNVEAGSGEFVPMKPYSPYVYGTIANKAKAATRNGVVRDQ